jgi:hypothetical protein
MRTPIATTLLNLAGASVIVVAVSSIILTVLHYWGAPPMQMQQPTYNAASLPRVSAGQTLDFANGQNGNALLAGWSAAESYGVWSDGHAAIVGFVVEGTDAPKLAIVRGMAFVVPGKLNEQWVQVWSGGKKLGEFALRNADAVFAVPLSDLTIGNGTPVILGFFFPDAEPPKEIGGNLDLRTLSLNLKSLQLTP